MKKGNLLFLGFVLLSACSISKSSIVATNTPEDILRKFPYITDVNRYSEVMESITPTTVIEHFPEDIPLEATNVKFAYQPRIMQGAMFVELIVTLPEDQINGLWDKYSSFEKYQFAEDKTLNDIPEPILFLISDENNGVDQNFSIFFINAEPAGKKDFMWNHGTMYGVGINPTSLQVIYWLQYW